MTEEKLLDLILGGSIILLLFALIFVIAFIVIYLISLSKLFKKAGKKGWEAIVPLYNTYVLIEIAGLNWWYFLIAILGTITTTLEIEHFTLISNIGGAVINFFVFYNLAKKMHKDPIKIAIGGLLVPGIMTIVLGLSKNFTYDETIEVSPNGPINDQKTETNKVQERFCLGCGQKLKPNALFCENCGKKVD